MVTKRGGVWYAYFDPFKTRHQVGLKLDVRTEAEAKQIEAMILRACRTDNYSILDSTGREAVMRLFKNQGWKLPDCLKPVAPQGPAEELTLWRAIQLFLKYPDVRESATRLRHEITLNHLTEHFGADRALTTIKVPDLKAYQVERLHKGASPGTVNREMETVSRLFRVMNELEYMDKNPARYVRRLSTRSSERRVYLSRETVQAIADKCPDWYHPILWTGYYTGMRRGEILGLMRKRVHLDRRIIELGPEDTKEGDWKRVPIHRELVPILEEVLRGPALISGRVFPLQDNEGGIRELGLRAFRNPWPRACEALCKEEQRQRVKEPKWEKPWPVFHDLRHTWRANARRSGVNSEIAESILGHWFRGKPINELYGYISDEELLAAVDKMTFDHGATQILVAGGTRKKNAEQMLNKSPQRRETAGCALHSTG